MDKRKLRRHQRFALRFINSKDGRAGLFLAPGTGKTITAIRYAIKHPPALIVCRRDDFLTWQIELTNEGESDFLFIEDGDFDTKQRQGKWTFVTYDLMKNDSIHKWVKSKKFGIVIADECHNIKRWSAQRTKRVVKGTRHIPRRLGLSGTPIGNDPLDIYSQALFIDDGATFGDSEWWFRKKYYIRSGKGWYLKRASKVLIQAKVDSMSFGVHEDDVLKLPPIRHMIKSVKMSPSQQKHYDRILHEFEYEIQEGKIIEIDQVIVQLAKLRQVASGFLYMPDKTTHWLKAPKIELLFSLINELKKPKVVIWCAHTAEIEKIAETARKLKIGHVTFYGSDRNQKNAARLAFKNDASVQLFIAQVDAGVGMNELVVADTAFYVSNSFKAISRQQSMRRTRRIGSERHKAIYYYDLCVENSVDVSLLANLRTKMSLAAFILQQLRDGNKNVSRILRSAA